MTKPFNCRALCVDTMGNRTYFEITAGKVSCFGPDLTPYAISNIAQSNAADLRFALMDAESDREVLAALDKFAIISKTNSIL